MSSNVNANFMDLIKDVQSLTKQDLLSIPCDPELERKLYETVNSRIPLNPMSPEMLERLKDKGYIKRTPIERVVVLVKNHSCATAAVALGILCALNAIYASK